MTKDNQILQVKIALVGTKPPIWRRVLVEPTVTLAKFSGIIQLLMGWDGSHLHEFEADGETYGPPGNDCKNENRVRLGTVLSSPKDRLRYVYDFGDDWRHDIVLEKVLPREADQLYPWVVTGKGECLPEDCGGVYGYYDLLAALADPSHPNHKDMIEWIGEDFKPEPFDANDFNSILHPPKKMGKQA